MTQLICMKDPNPIILDINKKGEFTNREGELNVGESHTVSWNKFMKKRFEDESVNNFVLYRTGCLTQAQKEKANGSLVPLSEKLLDSWSELMKNIGKELKNVTKKIKKIDDQISAIQTKINVELPKKYKKTKSIVFAIAVGLTVAIIFASIISAIVLSAGIALPVVVGSVAFFLTVIIGRSVINKAEKELDTKIEEQKQLNIKREEEGNIVSNNHDKIKKRYNKVIQDKIKLEDLLNIQTEENRKRKTKNSLSINILIASESIEVPTLTKETKKSILKKLVKQKIIFSAPSPTNSIPKLTLTGAASR